MVPWLNSAHHAVHGVGEADEGLVVADEHVDADAICVETVQDVLDRLGAGGVLQAVNSNCHLGNSVQMSLNISVRDWLTIKGFQIPCEYWLGCR